MSLISKWSNVAVAVQSAIGVAKVITGISKASPGVVTSTAHGYANGDYVLLAVQGMYQLDGIVARINAITANTFNLEGLDTTLFDTFTSGSAQSITFGTSLTTATSINASGGDFDFIDTTTIHDNIKKQIPGLPSPGTFTMDLFWDVSDAGLIALKAASDNQAQRAVRFTFANGQKVTFNGYVGASGLPTGGAQDLVKTSVVITMFGKPNIYAN
jgi:hypothetical protein